MIAEVEALNKQLVGVGERMDVIQKLFQNLNSKIDELNTRTKSLAEIFGKTGFHVERIHKLLEDPGKYCLAVTADGLIVMQKE